MLERGPVGVAARVPVVLVRSVDRPRSESALAGHVSVQRLPLRLDGAELGLDAIRDGQSAVARDAHDVGLGRREPRHPLRQGPH